MFWRSNTIVGGDTEDANGISSGLPSIPKPRLLPNPDVHFFSPPKQRQRWGDTQILPHVNWGDLFFDLFYVAAAYNLSAIIKDSPTDEGLLYLLGCFGPIMLVWLDKMYYDARFAADDDVIHRLFEVLQLAILATSVLHIRPVGILSDPYTHNDMFAFSLASVLAQVLGILRYVEIMFWVDGEPCAKASARRDATSKLVPTAFFLAATIVSGVAYEGDDDDHTGRLLAGAEKPAEDTDRSTNVPIYLCLFGWISWAIYQYVFIVFLLPGGGQHKTVVVPMNIEFGIHRYGEWTMLMLGESVLSLLIVDISDLFTKFYVTFYAGVLSVILLQYLHFRSQPHSADEHALRRSKHGAMLFTFLMQIYSAALIVIGVSYKMLLTEYTYEENSDDDYRLLEMLSSLPPEVRNLLAPEGQRLLAGGSSESKFSTEERQDRIANFFCGSLAIAWVCLDLMILTHKGLRSNAKRCKCNITHKVNVAGIVLVLLRVGLVAFVATLSRYENDPEHLAIIGLAAIVAQVILRVLGEAVFPSKNHMTPDVGRKGEKSGVDDEKWPNVTEPRSIPAETEKAGA